MGLFYALQRVKKNRAIPKVGPAVSAPKQNLMPVG